MTKTNVLYNDTPTLKTLLELSHGTFFRIHECGNDLYLRVQDHIVNVHTGEITPSAIFRSDECAIPYSTAKIKLFT